MTKLATNQEARGAIRMACLRIAVKYPFHGALVSDWRMISDRSQRTLAVTIKDYRVCLLYAPSFVTECTLDQLVGVLHHEVNHVVLGHLADNPDKFPDGEARIIAQEISANEFVREPLPGQPITLADYPDFPAGESTECRYRRLRKLGEGSAKSGWNTGSEVPNPGTHVPKTVEDVRNPAPDERKHAPPEPLDDHDLWGKTQETPTAAHATIRTAVRTAWDSVDADGKRALDHGLRHRVESLCHGNTAGSDSEAISAMHTENPLDWKRRLQQFASLAGEPQESFAWPSRRLPELLGVVPGRRRSRGRARVMAVLDTSGSISSELLEQINGELCELGRHHQITVVECDASVQAVYPFHGQLDIVRGRGGTDLRPPLRPQCWRPLRPDVIVYFTDGLGPVPSNSPGKPLLWCLTPGGTIPASYGRVVRMEEDIES